jgi:hypothetical protein
MDARKDSKKIAKPFIVVRICGLFYSLAKGKWQGTGKAKTIPTELHPVSVNPFPYPPITGKPFLASRNDSGKRFGRFACGGGIHARCSPVPRSGTTPNLIEMRTP